METKFKTVEAEKPEWLEWLPGRLITHQAQTPQVKQTHPITQTFRKVEGKTHRLSGFIGGTETNGDGGSFLATLAGLSPGVRGKNSSINDVASSAYDAHATTPQQMCVGRFAWMQVDCKAFNELPMRCKNCKV